MICFQDSLSFKSHFNVLRIFSIVSFVSFTLVGCSCFRLLYCYHGHVKFLFLSIARLVSRTPRAFLSIDYYLGILGPVVRRPISANPGLNFNLSFFIPLLKSLFGKIFSVLFKASSSRTLNKKNSTEFSCKASRSEIGFHTNPGLS